MGSFNQLCAISNSSIQKGDRVALIITCKNTGFKQATYNTDLYFPISPPFFATYDDMGIFVDDKEFIKHNNMSIEFLKARIKGTYYLEDNEIEEILKMDFSKLENLMGSMRESNYKYLEFTAIHYGIYERLVNDYFTDDDKVKLSTNIYKSIELIKSQQQDSLIDYNSLFNKSELKYFITNFKIQNLLVLGGFRDSFDGLQELIISIDKNSPDVDILTECFAQYKYGYTLFNNLKLLFVPHLYGSQTTNYTDTLNKSLIISEVVLDLIVKDETNQCNFVYDFPQYEDLEPEELEPIFLEYLSDLSMSQLRKFLNE